MIKQWHFKITDRCWVVWILFLCSVSETNSVRSKNGTCATTVAPAPPHTHTHIHTHTHTTDMQTAHTQTVFSVFHTPMNLHSTLPVSGSHKGTSLKDWPFLHVQQVDQWQQPGLNCRKRPFVAAELDLVLQPAWAWTVRMEHAAWAS